MKLPHPTAIKLTAQLPGDGRRDELPRRRKLVESLEQAIEPFRYRRAALSSETARRRDV